MIREVLAQHPWLWALIWQSSICLAAGLAASVLLRRRPVRAHQLLLLSLIAAILIPTLSHAVRQNQWGLFVAERTVSIREAQPFIIQTDPATAAQAPASNTPAEPAGAVVSPSGTPAPATPRFQWQTALPFLWLGATSALLLRLMARLLLGLSLVRRSAPAQSRPIAEALSAAKAKLSVEGDVIVRASPQTPSPVIWCWGRRPVLLVPRSSCVDGRLDWSSILCHELAHWKRRDHASSLLAELMICLIPWQPFFWLARRRLLDLSEEACDDWVIASGQAGMPYARTLLSLIPQGRAILAPGVVTSRTGIARRVRRILEEKCGSPRSGRRWTFATLILASSITFGVAFAQTRPSHATGMSRTTLGHGAVIEQPASAVIIRGVVLDPNGKPTFASVNALPITTDGVKTGGTGSFELFWSPDWLGKARTLYLIARGEYPYGDKTAFMEVSDPNSPVTIRLSSSFSLEGKVVDPNGQRIKKYYATLSLPIDFKCQAPIFSRTGDARTVRVFGPVPYGSAYDLTIMAEGYQTKHSSVDARDRGKAVIDLGDIVLEPQSPTKPSTAEQGPYPNWREAFDRVYRLAEGEAIKLIEPPYVLERHEYVLTWERGLHSDTCLTMQGHSKFCFHWDGQLMPCYSRAGGPIYLRHMLSRGLGIPTYDCEVAKELDIPVPDGDWVINNAASLEERLQALEEIIRTKMNRPIRFEKRTVERDTIVATGRYVFTPLPNRNPDQLQVFVNDAANMWNGEATSLPDFLRQLGDGMHIAIDDRTESTQTGKIMYEYEVSIVNIVFCDRAIDKQKELPILIDNLAKQTGLQFKVEKQPAEVWFATEKASN